MSTFLFDQIVFGPVMSRRLGVSLGINLLPVDLKYCNFNCLYCECGWNQNRKPHREEFPTRIQVKQALEERLIQMQGKGEVLDVITFAGNGEPTVHPDFALIVDDCITLRNNYFPLARIAVLSNATMLHNQAVFNALLKVDQNILKLDSVNPQTLNLLNQPPKGFTVERLIEQLVSFQGKLIVQTMLVRGSYNGQSIDNTSDGELNGLIKALVKIAPVQVMIYTIDRDTPVKTLVKLGVAELDDIAGKMRLAGLNVSISS
jgi:wyosine [tRNA(Phe)-imidazoG37] synthetase (radical SAM superfamily)